MGHYVYLTCQNCGQSFQRKAAEAARGKRLGRQSYCSRTCTGRGVSKNLPCYDSAKSYRIAKHAANKRDEYSGFREHLRRCRQREHGVSITLEDLRTQWNVQQGKCPYTGLELVQPSYQLRNDILHTASLDRIDSQFGYVVGNIQFVSMAMNFAKSTLSHEQTVALCHTITRHWHKVLECTSTEKVQ